MMAGVYELLQGATLNPGERLYVHVGRSITERLHHHFDRDNTVLPDCGKKWSRY